MSKLYRLHKQYSPISTKSHCSICLYASALPTVHIKRKAPAFPIRTKQKIMSFFSLITPQFQYIDLYLWRKTRLKVSHLDECPVLCIRIFFPRRCRWVDVMLPFQGVAVYNWLKAINIISLWQRHRFIIIHPRSRPVF